jgi:hypothetical protein
MGIDDAIATNHGSMYEPPTPIANTVHRLARSCLTRYARTVRARSIAGAITELPENTEIWNPLSERRSGIVPQATEKCPTRRLDQETSAKQSLT